ncbi:MAG TPA: dihydroneopterin aldolase [Egibacteraceae bacterium]
MDRIDVTGLRAYGRHGVLARERREGQPFVIDLSMELDLDAAARSDSLADTVDYGKVAEAVVAAVESTRFDLLEALAGHLTEVVLASGPIAAATVRVRKPQAPIGVPFDEVSVQLRRERQR